MEMLLPFVFLALFSRNPLDFWFCMLVLGYLARSHRNSP